MTVATVTVVDVEGPPARLEVPVCRATPVAIRTISTDGPIMEGHFSTFGDWYEIDSVFEGRFLERIAPGAFRTAFRESRDRIRVLLEHGMDPTVGDKPLGVPEVLSEDETGAYYRVKLFDTSYVRDLLPALEAGVYSASFRFRVVRDEWNMEPERSEFNPERLPERTIRDVHVLEFGPTVFPANPNATAGLRSTTDRYYERLRERAPQEFDEVLRSVSRSRTPRAVTGAPATRRPGAPAVGGDAAPLECVHSPAATETKGIAVETTAVGQTMSVEERAARQSEIRARLQEIDAEYPGSVLPDDVQAEWDALSEEYDEHERSIQAAQARMERIRQLSRTSVEAGAGQAQAPVAATTTTVRRPENIYDLSEVRRMARSEDELADLYRDNARRVIEQAQFPGVRSREDAQTRVERLLTEVDDDSAALARRIIVTGSPLYEKAFGKALQRRSTMGLTAEEQRALSLGSDPDGGFAVPFQLDPTVVLTSDGSVNPLRQVSRVVQITGKEWQAITSDGITVSRRGEATEATDDAPQIGQVTIRPTSVDAFIPFSIEIDQDWSTMRAEMLTLLADAKEQEEAHAFVNGDGTGDNPAGLIATMPAASLVELDAAGLASSDLYRVEEALPPRFRARASWMANRGIYNRIRQLDTAGGADLWVRLAAAQPAELIGYPARELSTMSDQVTAGERILVLGDFSHFVIVDRVGMSVELIPHLFGENRRPTGQRGIYAHWRNSAAILNPNAFRVAVVPTP